MKIPGETRLTRWLVALLLAGLVAPAFAQTVRGRVDSVSDEQITVGGTRFMVGQETVIQPSPASPEKTVPFDPDQFDDVWKVRVTGTGRLAERIVILPYRDEGGEGQ